MKVDSLKISTNLKNFRYINQPLPPPKRKTKKYTHTKNSKWTKVLNIDLKP